MEQPESHLGSATGHQSTVYTLTLSSVLFVNSEA